jgi:hypothetical protein
MGNVAAIQRRGSYGRWTILVIFVLLAAMACLGQEYRATITGIVTDSSKAVISNATVSVRNLDTNEVIKVQVDAAGVYTIPFLHPGHKLEVSAEAPGFKKSTYPPITLNISQTETANFELQVGGANEVVTVTSEGFDVGLDDAKADRGLEIDNKTLTQLPLNGRNVMSLMDSLSGITDENGAGSIYSGPVGANNMYYAGQYTVNGGKAANIEFTIDGMANNSVPWYGANGPSAIPSIDAMQEVKVVTNPYDAQQGRSAGGQVNMELKSGTNELHGAAWEFGKRGYMDANSWQNNASDTPRPTHTEDQYGFEVGGPVYIPHIYNGKNKTFFMFNLERLKENLPANWRFEMPAAQWLNGDFSNLQDFSSNCLTTVSSCLIPIYDPATRNAAGTAQQIFDFNGQVNHVDPGRFNPVSVNVIKMILAAATPTTQIFPGEAPWETYWIDNGTQNQWAHNYIFKVDHVLSDKDRISVNYFHHQSLNEYLTAPAGPLANGENFSEYSLVTGVDWVHTFRSNLLLDFHVSYQRYWRKDGYPNSTFNPATLGFDPAFLAEVPTKSGFPQISFSSGASPAPNVSINPGYGSWLNPSRDYYYMPDDTISIAPTVTWIRGKHTIRTGLDLRFMHLNQILNYSNVVQMDSNGFATNEYYNKGDFNDQATAPDGTPLSTQAGNPVLDFLLGQPDSVSVTNQVFPYYNWHYIAPWFQDDWKVSHRLTLNLGVRYDLNGPPTARKGWLNTGFDTSVVNPINTAAQAAATNLGVTLPTVMGGITFPTGSNNLPWNADRTKIQPRIGFAYRLDDKTVIRGGFGRIVMSPLENPQAAGFTNNPVFLDSGDGGHTLYNAGGTGNGAGVLYNPFALSGGVPAIPGSSAGYLTQVGSGVAYANRNYRLPYVNSSSLGIERALPKKGKLEISYVGSRSYDQDVNNNVVNLDRSLAQQCNEALGTAANPQPSDPCVNTTVPNPFYGLPGVLGGLGSVQFITPLQLASPYPEFTGVTEVQVNTGKTWYNSLQTVYTQHVSWVQMSASWTWSKTMSNFPGYYNNTYLDQVYQIPFRDIAPTDRKNRVTLQSVLDIPVGRGRPFLSGMNRALDALVGNWQLGGDYFWESGQPLSTPGGFNLVGNVHAPKQHISGIIDTGYNSCYELWNPSTPTSPGFYSAPQGNCTNGVAWQQIAPYAPTYTQPYTDAIRAPILQQIDVDLNKSFKFGERVSMQLRMEMFNVLNHPTFGGPYSVNTNLYSGVFGQVIKANGQTDNPRQGQLGVKILW